MSDGFVRPPIDSNGKFVDTSELIVGANTVERQRIVLADDSVAAALVKILNVDPTGNEYGLVVRAIQPAASTLHVVAASGTNAQNVKPSAGQLVGWSIFSAANYALYVKLHNTAGVPTAGAGVVFTIGIQAGEPSLIMLPFPRAFSTGIGLSITKLIADSDTTSVVANDCVVELFYK